MLRSGQQRFKGTYLELKKQGGKFGEKGPARATIPHLGIDFYNAISLGQKTLIPEKKKGRRSLRSKVIPKKIS